MERSCRKPAAVIDGSAVVKLMARIKLVWRFVPAFILIAVICLLAGVLYTAGSWREFYLQETAGDLENRARLVEIYLQDMRQGPDESQINEVCRKLGKLTATRFTAILASGQVIGDSQENPQRMDNHGDRPEVREAVEGRVGVSTRFSFTLGHNMMYVAVPWRQPGRPPGAVRASLPMQAVEGAIRSLYQKIALGGLGLALAIAALSFWMARRITGPLDDLKRGALRFARGDLDRKLPIPGTDELASLAEALNYMADQVQKQIQALSRQGKEQEAILTSMTEGVLALDAEGRLLRVNQAGARMLNLDPAAAQNQPVQEVIRDSGLKWFINRTLSNPEPIEDELEIRDDGRKIFKAHGASLLDSQGISLGTLVVLYDITQLRQLENTRRDFVANVSHELKTPITSIKGFVETLLAGALTEPEHAEKFLKIIAKQADRLDEIIDDLLTLSRIEQDAKRRQIFLNGQKIQAVLVSAIQVCEAKAAEKQITVKLDCPDNLRARVNAPLLEQALVNLVGNAVKFSEPGSEVRVEARREGARAVIRVRDQGPGIPPEHLPRIFERFYRADAGRSRKIGGSGLGLAIVKHIALAHGGQVTATSAPGQETVFSLYLQAD
jgi:two-component system, OmpR family, phosphate regulon sensor histidine kinase PhoR